MNETKTLPVPTASTHEADGEPGWLPEYDELLPNLDDLVTEDGEPVDNLYVEKLYKLMTEPLHASWDPGRPFVTAANVGWFHTLGAKPVAPDVMVSLDVTPRDSGTREGRSYFQWILGKPPDVAVEVVSDRRGGEFDGKLMLYERLGLPYYVVHDPDGVYDRGPLCAFELRGGKYAAIDPGWLPNLGLGVTLWRGEYEGVTRDWLRWCGPGGVLIPTGQENAAAQRRRADEEKARADEEKGRADASEEYNRRLLALLKERGIDPPK